jgi:serine protease Do
MEEMTISLDRPEYSGVRLGILGRDVNPDIATALGLPRNQPGVLVVEVQLGSIAKHMGLQSSTQTITNLGEQVMTGGDIITRVNNRSVSTIQQLKITLVGITLDDKFSLTILRNGSERLVHFNSGK